ncbi:MAG TPA: CoA transferase [Acidimicrobiia bacterium]|nr:CoA transferase [Acidimicrobiia bacterium]
MTSILHGTRVLEVAFWTFVPAAGAILADWGADVLKVEHPETGDPQRGLATLGVMPGASGDGADFMIQFPNRGKRSIGIDLHTDEGRELIYRLAKTADVFLTNFLPDARTRMQIDVEHIRAANPNIIYVRGHGQGAKGPDATKGGYDGASFWARGGMGDTLRPADSDLPAGMRPAIGDVMGGLAIAAGISAALYQRERTGHAAVVDTSLLNTAMWQLQPDVVMSGVLGLDDIPRFANNTAANPLVGNYRTGDGRWIFLNMMESDRFWSDFCTHLGRTDLIDDERYRDAKVRADNRKACVAEITDTFASKSFAEWRDALETMEGVWAPVQKVPELYDDKQVIANGYLCPVTDAQGNDLSLVGAPVQFDEQPHQLTAAPEHGEHTDELMLELGYSWDEIIELKTSGAIL